MPPRQRTFDLIPTTLVKSTGPKPPMTSKAAKKAYQQANKGPRISRAEQRKRDAEELDRQKKEYERERAWAKAKAAREKKAAKDKAERDARRKMGLPEPSKHVHGSQPTIAMFVRGPGNNKRSWQQMENVAEDSEGTLEGGDVSDKDTAPPPAKRMAVVEDSEDEFGDFPSLSQTDILEKIDTPMSLSQGNSPFPKSHIANKAVPDSDEDSDVKLPTGRYSDDEFPFNDDQLLEELVTTQISSEAAEAAAKSDPVEPLIAESRDKGQLPSKERPESDGVFSKTATNKPTVNSQRLSQHKRASLVAKPVLQERSLNMLPPPRPSIHERKAITFAPGPVNQRVNRPANSWNQPNPPNGNLPSSTQAFLESHLDDFFPSPSQEIRELLEDVDDLPSNTQIAKELSSPVRPERDTNYEDLFCTQDLTFSSQDLEEINTPSRVPEQPKLRPKKALDTQALPPREKRRFFKEKEEDLLHAAIHESKIAANQNPFNTVSIPPRDTLSKAGPNHQSEPRKPAPRRSGRFFEEKEEDLVHAAIHESMVLAARNTRGPIPKRSTNKLMQQQKQDLTVKKNRGASNSTILSQEEDNDLLQAAIQESKMLAAQEQERLLNQASENNKRTLKRIQSTATDYGEDDFAGCSQELAALCEV